MQARRHGLADSTTHYEALCVREDATYAEIRAQYRSAMVTLHPDKKLSNASQIRPSNAEGVVDPHDPIPRLGQENSHRLVVGSQEYDALSSGHQVSTDYYANAQPGNRDEEFLQRFLRVQQAWGILKDIKSREAYDSELFALRHNTDVVVDDIELEEMKIERDGEGEVEYYCPCRCGDYFVAGEKELEEMGFKPSLCKGEEFSNLPLNEIGTEGKNPQATSRETAQGGQTTGEQKSRAATECSQEKERKKARSLSGSKHERRRFTKWVLESGCVVTLQELN